MCKIVHGLRPIERYNTCIQSANPLYSAARISICCNPQRAKSFFSKKSNLCNLSLSKILRTHSSCALCVGTIAVEVFAGRTLIKIVKRSSFTNERKKSRRERRSRSATRCLLTAVYYICFNRRGRHDKWQRNFQCGIDCTVARGC